MEGFIYDLNLIKGFNQASQLPLPLFNYLVDICHSFLCKKRNFGKNYERWKKF